jgi:hypothetical protein
MHGRVGAFYAPRVREGTQILQNKSGSADNASLCSSAVVSATHELLLAKSCLRGPPD